MFWDRKKITEESKVNRWRQWIDISGVISQSVDVSLPLKITPKSKSDTKDEKDTPISESNEGSEVIGQGQTDDSVNQKNDLVSQSDDPVEPEDETIGSVAKRIKTKESETSEQEA